MKSLFVFLSICLLSIDCQWVDPHDMNTNAKEKYIKSTNEKTALYPSVSKDQSFNNSEICYSNLKRIVGIIIRSAHIDKSDPELYHGRIRFNIDPHDLNILLTFGKEELTLDKLRRLDTIFTESFKNRFINDFLDDLESVSLKFYSVIENNIILWLGSIGLLYITYQLVRNNFSLSYIIKYLLIILLICDFGSTYKFLLKEAEEYNASITYSSHCDESKMSWTSWLKFFSSKKECEKKIVTPLSAGLHQIKNIIIVPLHALGTGMGGFGYNMFTSLPWGLNFVMWPLMLIFVIIVAIFMMVIFSGQSIEFNMFHLLKLKFGGTRPHEENAVAGSSLERLMDKLLHRPMVQNVNVTVPLDGIRNHQNPDNSSLAVTQNESSNCSSNDNSPPSGDDKTVIGKTGVTCQVKHTQVGCDGDKVSIKSDTESDSLREDECDIDNIKHETTDFKN